MDFISEFPKVEDFGSISVVVDMFYKYVVFIPAPSEFPPEEAAWIFFSKSMQHCRILKDLVSERETQFTSRFWVELFKICTKCKFFIVNRPQNNSQTERVNQMLEKYLSHYVIVVQTNWLELLEPAQLSYNLHQSLATRMSPFEVAIGFQPRTPLDVLDLEQLRHNVSPATYKFSKTQQDLLNEVRDNLEKASKRIKNYVDQGRRPLEFEKGEKVLLKLTP